MTPLETLADRVRDTPPGDSGRARVVSDELCRLLDRPARAGLAALVTEVRAADAAWRERPGPAERDRLAGLVEDLAVALDAVEADVDA